MRHRHAVEHAPAHGQGLRASVEGGERDHLVVEVRVAAHRDEIEVYLAVVGERAGDGLAHRGGQHGMGAKLPLAALVVGRGGAGLALDLVVERAGRGAPAEDLQEAVGRIQVGELRGTHRPGDVPVRRLEEPARAHG